MPFMLPANRRYGTGSGLLGRSLVGSEHNAPLLHAGDLLIVTSLDRLGRNYAEIHEQWRKITKEIRADIQILDMPLLDTRSDLFDLDHKFISDLVLQILSYVSEKERLHIKDRQRQEKNSVRNRGKKCDRPSVVLPEKYDETIAEWKAGKITTKEAMTRLGMKRTTFYKIVKNS